MYVKFIYNIYIYITSSIFLQLLLGFIFADIITGRFHWFEDTYFDYCIDISLITDIKGI